MKISHELPLSLLEYSNDWNDYEYCLPHLLDKHSDYRQYFLDSRERGIISEYFGLSGKPKTLEEIGSGLNLTKERVRQIKEKAVRRLKHSSRSKLLAGYLG
jgi:DNA-directed RNA polymerase sigma subunit (sigma70/sigma32)